MRGLATAAAMAMLFCGGGPAAAAVCAEPVRPFCIDEGQRADGELSQQRCAEMVDRYIEELGGYIDCLKRSVAESEKQHTAMKERLACMRETERTCR